MNISSNGNSVAVAQSFQQNYPAPQNYSRTDRGVLTLLDNRITKTRYGQIFFDSLPHYAFTTKREDVERFFEHV